MPYIAEHLVASLEEWQVPLASIEQVTIADRHKLSLIELDRENGYYAARINMGFLPLINSL